jgi:predicted ATPase/transcriptional regulator with XRE-family HTH domain
MAEEADTNDWHGASIARPSRSGHRHPDTLSGRLQRADVQVAEGGASEEDGMTQAGAAASFGSLLREYRLAAGLSQEVLAERARISAAAIGALERGVRHAPQRQTLALLVEALGLRGADRDRFCSAAVRPAQPRRRPAHPEGGAAMPLHVARPLTALVGRDDELAAIRTLVAHNRLVTITGSGGVGKTRIALELAITNEATYRDGAVFVDLAPLSSPAFVEHQIASVLEIEERSDRPLRELLVSALRSKHLLLVVDNCEHVIDEVAAILEALLHATSHLEVLATSREALRIEGERVYPLPSLPADAATMLFIDRATACDPNFQLADGTLGVVEEICRRLDGIPFAIELAAAKVAMMSVRELSDRLRERFDLLTDGKRTALPRHQTLAALIGWSYLLLSPQERALLRRLSVFPSTWTLAACAAVYGTSAEDVLPLLTSLVAKSLVVSERRFDDMARFRMHESTREYALRLLRDEGEIDEVRSAHAHYFGRLIEDAEQHLMALSQSDWLARVTRESDNGRAALEWALSEGHEPALGARIVTALGFFWYSRRYREGARWLELAVARIDELEPALAGRVLVEFVRTQPLTPRTLTLAELAVETYRRIGDPRGLCRALEYEGQSLINAGRFDDAEEALREALALGRSYQDRASLGRILALTGFVQVHRGHDDAARALFEEAATFATAAGQDRDLALVAQGQVELALAERDADGAVRRALATLDALERLEDARAAAWQRCQVARALLAADRASEAFPYACQAVRELRDALLPATFVEALLVAATVLVSLGERALATMTLGFCARQRLALFPFRIAPPIETIAKNAESQMRSALSADEFERHWACGERLDGDAIVEAIVRR